MDTTDILLLRQSVQKFTRIFGLIEHTTTPCGYPLSMSEVYALQEIEKKIMTISELAACLYLERSSVSRLVDGLVKENMVNRVINENNRREMLISLTEKGSQTIEKVRQQSIEFYKTVLNSLSEQEQQLILNGLSLFANTLLKNKEKIYEKQ